MRDKKVIVLIVLGIIAVMSIVYGVTASRPKKGPEEPAITAGETQQVQSQGAISFQRRAKRSEHTSWKRSPFVASGVSGSSSNLALSGIINSGRGLKAAIGDSIVGKGDTVGNYKVIDIKKDRVILNDGTKDLELKLRE